MRAYRLAILSSALLIAACSLSDSLSLGPGAADRLVGKEVHAVREASPLFAAVSAAQIFSGDIGQRRGVGDGARIVDQNALVDPSLLVEDALAAYLLERYGAAGEGPAIEFGEADKPEDPAQWSTTRAEDGLILDVETRHWGFAYFPTERSRYRVIYVAMVRIIDAGTGQTLAQHLCDKRGPDSADAAPTYDEMLDGQAALLKAMLAQHAAGCIEDVTTRVL
ncbi:MAG: hypothetical protein HKM95_09085 [Inquilinus sp.]|nr:hypothetical protein [Inquilinus sp.]